MTPPLLLLPRGDATDDDAATSITSAALAGRDRGRSAATPAGRGGLLTGVVLRPSLEITPPPQLPPTGVDSGVGAGVAEAGDPSARPVRAWAVAAVRPVPMDTETIERVDEPVAPARTCWSECCCAPAPARMCRAPKPSSPRAAPPLLD